MKILVGDALTVLGRLPSGSVHCCVTSPPYWGLRDYGVDGQLGLEKTPEEFIANMVAVFREVRRVLRDDATLFLNIGDSYFGGGRGGNPSESVYQKQATNAGSLVAPTPIPTGCKPKDLVGIPWSVAFALRADGWYLRSAMPWVKRSAMPESVTDRPASALEYVFLMTKKPRYFFDMDAIRKQGSGLSGGACFGKVNKDGPGSRRMNDGENDSIRSGTRTFRNTDLWYGSIEQPHGLTGVGDDLVGMDVNPEGYSGSHFAVMPTKLVEPCIKAGTSEKGCCAACGAPWRRVVEKTDELDTSAKGSTFDGGKTGSRDGGDRTQPGPRFTKRQTGWEPTCKCNADVVPCTVLDPFGGSGTTGLVADRLGRDSTLIELNPEYAAMARRRIEFDAGMFADVDLKA